MIPCHDFKSLKAVKSQNLYQLPKVLLHLWAENTSLTQKDTMDGRAWIKNLERKEDGGLVKAKAQKGTKVQVAWEWGTNE